MGRRLRRRFWLEATIALAAIVVAVMTVLVPDWLEVAFAIDPDEGNGVLEAGVTVVAASIALVSVIRARVEWRLAGAGSRA